MSTAAVPAAASALNAHSLDRPPVTKLPLVACSVLRYATPLVFAVGDLGGGGGRLRRGWEQQEHRGGQRRCRCACRCGDVADLRMRFMVDSLRWGSTGTPADPHAATGAGGEGGPCSKRVDGFRNAVIAWVIGLETGACPSHTVARQPRVFTGFPHAMTYAP